MSELTNLTYEDVSEESSGDWLVKIVTSQTDLRQEKQFYKVTGSDEVLVKNTFAS